jgi:hypothetical protein
MVKVLSKPARKDTAYGLVCLYAGEGCGTFTLKDDKGSILGKMINTYNCKINKNGQKYDNGFCKGAGASLRNGFC